MMHRGFFRGTTQSFTDTRLAAICFFPTAYAFMTTDGSIHRKSKREPEQDLAPPETSEFAAATWTKLAASVLIIGHIWAVFGRPIEFATQGPTGPSPASYNFYEPIRGYSEFAYLNHGYAFFAPDPGPSHLIRVRFERDEIENNADADGAQAGDVITEQWTFPDLKKQWPRLLYHRHFMLSEFLHNTYQPRQIPVPLAADESAVESWNRGRARYEAVLGSITNHLRKKAGTDEIEIQRLEHQLVGLPEFLAGQRTLDDPQHYRELLDEEAEAEMNIPRFGVPLGQPPGQPSGPPILFGGQR